LKFWRRRRHGDRLAKSDADRISAAPTVYLASDASAYHTRDSLLIDSGYSKF